MAQRIPHISEPLTEQTADGAVKINDNWHRYLDSLSTDLDKAVNSSDSGLAGKAAKEQAWHDASLIEFADDKTYRIIVNSAYGWTIENVTTRSAAGTCTVTISINGTPLGGDANSVSTTESTETHTSANVVSQGDDVEITISDNSGAESVSVNLIGTRTLA